MAGFFKRRVNPLFCFFAFFSVLFFSCIGASSQIKLNSDGSGTIIQEYRISLELENMGKLDGNENQPPLPAGKKDIERTIERVPGLRLVSYSSYEDGKDRIYRVELAFDSLEALVSLFSANNQQFKADLLQKRMEIRFSAAEKADLTYRELMGNAFEGYGFSISFSVPGTAKTAWFDENGNKVQQFPGACSVKDKIVEYSAPMADIVFLYNSLTLEISW